MFRRRPARTRAALSQSALLFLFLGSIVAIAIVAKRLALPYPIAFVIGGSALALVPNLPTIALDPHLVFLIFLPPLLFAGGWLTDWKMFKFNIRPIALLAIGLVIFTTGIVALVTHALVPAIGWAAAFALGAIISPPDAVAAGAVFERFSVPSRIVAILDGEGLVNDATALVIYQFAVAAVVTGTFSAAGAGLAFFGVSIGGIAIGLGYGWAIVALYMLLRKAALSDVLIDNVIMLLAPYAIYLTADSVHVSGVLATVAAGVFISRKQNAIFDPEGRLVSYSVWSTLTFLLNGIVFLLIGIQLRSIVREPTFALRELWIAGIVSLVVIVVRIAWVYPATYLPRLFSPAVREREGMPGWNYVFIVAWSGMRGIVSLAAALALPVRIGNGQPFPGRATILFITFIVIFATLVFQGLSLIPLLKWLRIEGDENIEQREVEVRVAALRAGVGELRRLESDFGSTEEWEIEGRIIGDYEYRIAHLLGHFDGSITGDEVALDHRLQKAALDAERAEVERMRAAGEIPDELFRKIQYDLDLADGRIT
jgi:CPA1 family monovalent cation:H+ antiporter